LETGIKGSYRPGLMALFPLVLVRNRVSQQKLDNQCTFTTNSLKTDRILQFRRIAVVLSISYTNIVVFLELTERLGLHIPSRVLYNDNLRIYMSPNIFVTVNDAQQILNLAAYV
jgi:hypothetical protein